MRNPVVHFEIGAADHQSLGKFYGELFGWGLREVSEGYTLVDTRGGQGLNGGIGRSGTGEPWATFYVEVDDLQASLDRAGALGGRTVLAITEMPGMAFAMFDDPDGLLVGLVRGGGSQDQVFQRPSAGDGAAVDWFEVLGADAGRSQAFYAELFGWTVPGGAYGQVSPEGGRGIGGGIGAGGAQRWATVYAGVADVEAALARAEALGGTRVYGPDRGGGGDADGRVPRPGGQRVRRLPPRRVLSDPGFYRGRSLWLDGLARRPAGPPAAPARSGRRRRGHRRGRLHRAVDRLLPAAGRPGDADRGAGAGGRRVRGLGAQRRLVLGVRGHGPRAPGPQGRAGSGDRAPAGDVRHRRRGRPGGRAGGHRLPLRQGGRPPGGRLPGAAGPAGGRAPRTPAGGAWAPTTSGCSAGPRPSGGSGWPGCWTPPSPPTAPPSTRPGWPAAWPGWSNGSACPSTSRPR